MEDFLNIFAEEESSHTSDHSSSHAESEGHEHSDFGLGTLMVALGLGIASRIYLAQATGLPYTVLLLILGIALGIILHEVWSMSRLGDSLHDWTDVPSGVILFVFLPVLIFESAFDTDIHIFQREFWQVMTLAGPGVIISTGLIGCVVMYVFPYGWAWSTAMMLGAILSVTDPIAITALLKEVDVSERLGTLIEGESLINNGTAIVIFVLFRNALLDIGDNSAIGRVETAAQLALGGPVVGLVMGMFGSFSLGYIIDDAWTEISLTVIVCYSTYLIAEATELLVSGVLAVVTAGLVMSFYARGRISPGVEESMHTFWSMATYVANTVIFFISGLIIGDRAIFASNIGGREWGLAFFLYVLVQFVRVNVVILLSPVLTAGSYGMDYKQLCVLAFAGLRGAVGLTLALTVIEDDRIDEATRDLVLFYVAGVAVLTLVINGTLVSALVRYLGLDRSSTAETEIFVRACSAIEARLEHKLDLLKGDRFLGDADWEMVWRYIPVSTAKAYWHRIRHGNIRLSAGEEHDIHTGHPGRDEQGGVCAEIQYRGRQIRKWFMRRVVRRPGGVGYDKLPFRLRQTWHNYHKNFHLGAVSAAHLDSAQHRREMEMYKTNAGPRMMLEADAWSNLNEGGPGVDDTAQLPTSGTWRKHVDDVGMSSTSGPGKRNEVAQSMFDILKLKEDRRRANQAVAKAESRLLRLERDMGLLADKGMEEEIAEALLLAKSKGVPSSILLGNLVATPGDNTPAHSLHGDASGKRMSANTSFDTKLSFAMKGSKALGLFSASPSSDADRRTGGKPGIRLGAKTLSFSNVSAAKHRIMPSAEADGLPPWNPYGRDDDDDDIGTSGAKVLDEDDEPRLGGMAGPGTVTMGSMSEARVRFLTAVKAHCSERYRQGWVSSMGLRVLKESMDNELDFVEREFEQWSHLSKAFTLPAYSMAIMRKIPIIGRVMEPYMYRRLMFVFELASNFISAHEDVDILELLNEGPVAYQLALEKNRQLQDARETLASQLPVFPELARSLKTKVAARYMLVQHRDIVHELFHNGHINEREFDRLVEQNNMSRVRLDYHPHIDTIPDRFELLKDVPFLRFLSDDQKKAIINDEKACQEQFYGSNVVLMEEKMSSAKGQKRAGWFNVVRGAVRQTTEGLPDFKLVEPGTRQHLIAKERLVNAGTVIGLDDQLLQVPYRSTYVTASYVHLFFFDKTQMMILAERYPGLKRGLWWLLAVSIVRHHHGFRLMNLMNVYQLMRTAEFMDLKTSALNGSRHGKYAGSGWSTPGPFGHASRARSIAPSSGRPKSSDNLAGEANRRASADDGRSTPNSVFGTKLSANSNKPSKSSMGGRRNSRGQLSQLAGDGKDDVGRTGGVTHRVILEEGSWVLLLRGSMLPQMSEDFSPYFAMEAQTAVTIIRDVSGPAYFEDGSVLFVMPPSLLARSTSSHQLLMRDIQDHPRALASAARAEAEAAAMIYGMDSPEQIPMRRMSSGASVDTSLYPSGGGAVLSPSRMHLGSSMGSGAGRDAVEMSRAEEAALRSAMAMDVDPLSAGDEADPDVQMDILRRKRELRDAEWAAKASGASGTTGVSAAGGGFYGSGSQSTRYDGTFYSQGSSKASHHHSGSSAHADQGVSRLEEGRVNEDPRVNVDAVHADNADHDGMFF